MPLTMAKILLPVITTFPHYMSSEIPVEQALLEWWIELRGVAAASNPGANICLHHISWEELNVSKELKKWQKLFKGLKS